MDRRNSPKLPQWLADWIDNVQLKAEIKTDHNKTVIVVSFPPLDKKYYHAAEFWLKMHHSKTLNGGGLLVGYIHRKNKVRTHANRKEHFLGKPQLEDCSFEHYWPNRAYGAVYRPIVRRVQLPELFSGRIMLHSLDLLPVVKKGNKNGWLFANSWNGIAVRILCSNHRATSNILWAIKYK